MKITIGSNIEDGTTIKDESGFEFLKTDEAGEITLYIQGLLTEFPEAELVFKNDYPRGTIFEAGKLDGKNLRRKSEKYEIFYAVPNWSAKDSRILGKISPKNTNHAFEEFQRIKKTPDITDCILIDQRGRIVQVGKGSISPFTKELNRILSDWKEGEIKFT